MSKLPNSNSDSNDTGMRQTEDRPPRTPRWVRVSGTIAIVLVLLIVILKITGVGGNHGPGRHIPGGEPAEQIERDAYGGEAPGDHTPTEGGH